MAGPVRGGSGRTERGRDVSVDVRGAPTEGNQGSSTYPSGSRPWMLPGTIQRANLGGQTPPQPIVLASWWGHCVSVPR